MQTKTNEANEIITIDGEVLDRFGVSHQTTPLTEGPGSISTTPSGSPGLVSKDGGLKKFHDTHLNPIRLLRMVDKIESIARRLKFLWGMQPLGRDSHLIHHPCKTDGVLCSVETRRV